MKFGIAPLILLLLPANLVNIVGAKDTVYAPKPVNELRQEEDDIGMRIVNGVEVNPKFKYPYMVYAGGCGASLVAPNVVLCAAHCAGFISSVQIGRHNINDGSEDFETFDVLQEVPHPSYNDDTLDYDFMMMRLDGSSSRTPVQLDSGISLDSGRDVIAMGWGTTSSGGFSSSVLLEVELDLKSQSECNSNYGAGQITDRMVCAARATKDSCQGDSGGPLIDKATGVQVGVVSWGYGCADSRYPGVYAKVQDQKDWIQSYIDLWSDGPSPPTPPPVTSPTPPPTECTDFSGWVDSYGDGCDWYVANDNEGSCDTYGWGYDAGLGTAQEACCYCGGGNRGPTTPPPTPSPTVPPTPNPTRPPTPSPTTLPPVTSPTPPPATSPTPSGCTDYPAWVDSYGDGCDWYAANDNEGSCDTFGSGFDAGFGTAQEACCYCGGGDTGNGI